MDVWVGGGMKRHRFTQEELAAAPIFDMWLLGESAPQWQSEEACMGRLRRLSLLERVPAAVLPDGL
eukprot:2531618-Prorocentrum_lima.AAC.1